MYDVTILTCEAYYKPHELNSYISNILLEEQLIKESLESNGLKVDVTYWSNKSYDWTSTKSAVFRTVWDYFENFEKFHSWLNKIKNQTNGMELTYLLVADGEADLAAGKISVNSPIGKGLLGKSVGDVAEIQVPNGVIKFEILEITR